MTLPEHELNRRCHHSHVVDICPTRECQDELSEMEDEAERQRWADYAETGDDGFLMEIDRGALHT